MRLRGSVTVFISIILSALIAFSGVVVDLSRFRAGKDMPALLYSYRFIQRLPGILHR